MPIDLAYLDDEPIISADGTKVLFVSGRELVAGKGNLKIFKSDWLEGKAPSTPTRLTSEDFGSERKACLSPDGLNVAMIALSKGAINMMLGPFDGSSQMQLVNSVDENLGDFADCAFSPDGKLLAWISKEKSTKRSQLNLTDISTGIPQEVTAVDDGSAYIRDFFWMANPEKYSIVLTSTGHSSGRVRLERIEFSHLGDAKNTDLDLVFESSDVAYEVRPVGGTKKLLLSKRVRSSNVKYSKVFGNYKFEKEQAIPATSEPVVIDQISSQSAESLLSFGELPGFAVIDLALSADDSASFQLERNAWRCDSDSFTRYGASFVQSTASLDSLQRLVPRLSTNNSWEISDDYCDGQSSKDKLSIVDDRVKSFRLNSNAKPDNFRIIYVTNFSKAYDRECQHLIGDAEIFVMEVRGVDKKIYPVSLNSLELQSQTRSSGLAECAG